MKNITVIAIIIMAFFVSCNNRTKQADVNANTKDTLISYEEESIDQDYLSENGSSRFSVYG